MKRFDVKLSDQALEDADRVYDFICSRVLAPLTAARYYQGLIKKMHSLEQGADAIAIDLKLSSQYGIPMRRINYKKLAILYSVEEGLVIIERVIPQGIIK